MPMNLIIPKKKTVLSVIALSVAIVACDGDSGGERKAADHLLRSEAYSGQGQYRAAIIEARNAIKVNPADAKNTLMLASIYKDVGANRHVENLLLPLLEGHAEIVGLSLADAYVSMGKFVSAREILQKLPDTSSSDELSKRELIRAEILILRKEYEEAIELLKTLKSDSPTSYDVSESLIIALLGTNQQKEAQDVALQLLEALPEDPSVLYLNGHIAYLKNDLESAESHLSNALIYLQETDILLPIKSKVLRLLSKTLTELGRSTEALVYSKVLAEANPEAHSAEQRFSDALAQIKDGDIDSAQISLESLLEDNPDSPSAGIMLGLVKLEKGDIESAANLLGGNLDVETAKSELITATAFAQLRAGKTQEALDNLEGALLVRPGDPSLLATRGLLLLGFEGKEKAGAKDLQKVLSLEPWRVRLRLALARYYFSVNEEHQGLAQLRESFKVKPDEWGVTGSYLDYLLKTGNGREAKDVVSKLNDLYPKASKTRYYSAVVADKTGNKGVAIKLLEGLSLSDEDYKSGVIYLSGLYVQVGKERKALTLLEGLLGGGAEDVVVLRKGIDIVLSQSGLDGALDWLDSLVGRPIDREYLVSAKALILLKQGNIEAASTQVEELKKDIKSFNTEVASKVAGYVYKQRGVQLASQKEWVGAKKELLKAVAINRADKQAQLLLVKLHVSAGEFESAEQLLEELEERNPGNHELLLAKVAVIKAGKGNKAALNFLNDNWSQNLPPKAGFVLYRLARASGDVDLEGVFERWLSITNEVDAFPYTVMGQWYQGAGGQFEKAVEFYSKALEINPKQPVVLNNLAWMLKDTDLDKAVKFAKQAAEIAPKSSAVLDTYGWLLHLKGNKKEAVNQLEKALNLTPDSKEIAEHLAKARG